MSLKICLATLLLSLILPGIAQSQTTTKQKDSKTAAAIRAVLDAQRDAWNRGDVEGYMEGYSRSDTVMVSGDNVTRGWQTVLDRYKRNYNSREKMGTLTF